MINVKIPHKVRFIGTVLRSALSASTIALTINAGCGSRTYDVSTDRPALCLEDQCELEGLVPKSRLSYAAHTPLLVKSK